MAADTISLLTFQTAMQVLHFVAWRKLGMQIVYEAYMQKGLMCAYKTFASIPHLEKEYDNSNWLAKSQAVIKAC